MHQPADVVVRNAPVCLWLVMEWERPSERIRELRRQGAEIALNARPEWLEELDDATLAAEPMRTVADDPVLTAATRRSNRDNLLHWAAANVRDPGAPVPANLGSEPLGIARDLVRRGLDDSALHSYRIGQNVAWRRWMEIVFELTSDPQELRELLDISSRSITSFIDATVAGVSAQMQAEREELTRGTHAERRETVALILDGAPHHRPASRSPPRLPAQPTTHRRHRVERRTGCASEPPRTSGRGTHRIRLRPKATERPGQRRHPLGVDTRPHPSRPAPARRCIVTASRRPHRSRAHRGRNRRVSSQPPRRAHHPTHAGPPQLHPTHRQLQRRPARLTDHPRP